MSFKIKTITNETVDQIIDLLQPLPNEWENAMDDLKQSLGNDQQTTLIENEDGEIKALLTLLPYEPVVLKEIKEGKHHRDVFLSLTSTYEKPNILSLFVDTLLIKPVTKKRALVTFLYETFFLRVDEIEKKGIVINEFVAIVQTQKERDFFETLGFEYERYLLTDTDEVGIVLTATPRSLNQTYHKWVEKK